MSSSLLFSMLVKMDAGQAKAEMRAFTAAVEKAGNEVGALPTKTDPAKTSVRELGRAYDVAGAAAEKAAKVTAVAALAASRAELLRLKSTDAASQEDIAAAQAAYNKAKAIDATASAAIAASRAQVQATGTTQTLGRSHQAAAGSVGNLVAQFNDISMMIAAGQNPLQLAIQQGSQISQVIGPMGASGAVKALGSAFLGMLNPVNLVTFAVIAGGAALVQWAMSGEESTAAVEDGFKDVEAAIVDVKDKIATIKFGEENISVARVLDQMAGLEAQLNAINAQWRETDSLGTRQRLAEEAGLLKDQYAELQNLVQAYRDANAEKQRLQDQSTASDMLADLQAEADLNAVIAEYGAQSTEATAKRAEQERAAFVEKVKSLDVSDQMRLSLVASYDAANALAGVNFASGIGFGADEAARLGGNLTAAANAWLAARSEAQQPGRLALDKYGSRSTVSSRPIEDGNGEVIRLKTASGKVGSGAGKEADSVAKLIEKLQAEVDVSRELDPIQREMAQYRTQLAGATDVERQKVEALITQRLREKEVTESLEFVSKQSGDALIDALMGGADAGERLIDSLKRAALQALILGQGPLSGLLGGGLSAAFSLFSGPATGAFGLPFADGGMIYGAGGPRADQVPVMASAGEFIVNARATAQHRPLLERINNGAVPAFANGGIVGGGATVREGGSVTINIDARYAQQGVAEAIASAMQAMVPQIKSIAVGAVSDQMRRGRL